jgi:hypothetical protein
VVSALVDAEPWDGPRAEAAARTAETLADPLADGDLQLALALCYELHYDGLDGVPDEAEWDPRILAFRARLERLHLAALLEQVGTVPEVPPGGLVTVLRQLVADDPAPSLASWLQRHGGAEQFRDLVRQRSLYQLREADPHTWTIPRLRGRAKAALVEIQADEYGNGRPDRVHATLFAATMRALGLDDTYGAHWDSAIPAMLANLNTMSLFGLHRRWRAAAAGHLAAIEMTSTGPNRRYAAGLRRLGFEAATPYFEEHVEADAVHEQVAAVDLCGSLAADHPELVPDVVFGLQASLVHEGLFAVAMLERWGARARCPA